MSQIEIILGPTNTGKTFYAFEQMFTYKNGVFGFPLRLLARENFDKACKLYPINQIALITGEEKIIPKDAKYFFCTVESMPEDFFEFVCVDEIQLSSDYERGHIFTQRLLYSRGEQKTIFLGSLTMEEIICDLIPEAEIKFRNRFSELNFIGHKKIQNIKPRSAIIAFNLIGLYEIAEQIRSLKGGVALVAGALSPKTRNSQVKLYEDGEVDYIVATDAIGMGLNLDINQVYFSGLEKFDGKYVRPLNDMEIAQIAGRAGRHTKSGYFGSTLGAKFSKMESIENILTHKFEPIKKIFWRNHLLSFKSIYELKQSLVKAPNNQNLILKKDAEDQKYLFGFLKNKKSLNDFDDPISLRHLWDVCRIPDYQNISEERHISLLKDVFDELKKNDWVLGEDFLRKNISRLEDYSGTIDDLTYTLNETRIWLYITNQKQWMKNSLWVDHVKNIEDKLSDEIHLSLMQKFVDKNKSEMVQNLNISEKNILVTNNTYVMIKDEKIGVITGFKIFFDEQFQDILKSNYQKIIKEQISPYMHINIDNFLSAPNESLMIKPSFDDKGNFSKLNIYWGEASIATLIKGEEIFKPKIEVLKDDSLISQDQQLKILEKIQDWLTGTYIKKINLSDQLGQFNNTPEERSFIFKLNEKSFNFYELNILDEFKLIEESKRKEIHALNFRLGKNVIFNSELIRPELMKIKFYLWNIFNDKNFNIDTYIPKDGNATLNVSEKLDQELLSFLGFILQNDLLMRIDIFNEFEKQLFKRENRGPFSLPMDLSNLLGIKKEKLIDILKSRSFLIQEIEENDLLVSKKLSPNKAQIEKKNNKVIKKKPKKAMKPTSKKLFNNPFNQLKDINAK
ncbi:helicase-related protein [Alphaproteobacteria bacterium]|nr:helicase-related protein [Alphaproteobacteria bacterium]